MIMMILVFGSGIIHNGPQEGAGRLACESQQKARHFGSSRNRVALAVLDAAEGMGLISKEERHGKLTTAQRFLNSSVVKEALGIDASNLDDITYNRTPEDFNIQLGRFIAISKRESKFPPETIISKSKLTAASSRTTRILLENESNHKV